MNKLVQKLRRVKPIHAAKEVIGASHWLLRGRSILTVDYPPVQVPRWGNGLPVHPGLYDLMNRNRSAYENTLQGFLGYKNQLARISVRQNPDRPLAPYWVNGYFPGLDSVALYSFVAGFKPKTFLEIGSGHSTRFARAAIQDHSLGTKIISLDPAPRAEVNQICDQIIRAPLEEVDLGLFDRLEAGDIVFFDGSHRVLTNSDVTVFFMEVLPRLKSGVLIQIHDIFLPNDYPKDVIVHNFSEQYMLGTLLLFGGQHFETVLPNMFISGDEELSKILNPLWNQPGLSQVEQHGGSYWLIKK